MGDFAPAPGSSALTPAGLPPAPVGGHEPAEPSRPSTAPASEYVNVWSRTGPKYRFRAITLLLINLLLYGGMCVFTHWLQGAQPFDFSWSSYAEPLKFWGEQKRTLDDFVLYPISVEQNFMHGVVLGLLLASIVAVPICVGILYGFVFALPFIASVALLAHLPWMAITLVASTILAAVRPFRLSFRFGAALMGLLPVILYLALASRGNSERMAAFASPDEQLVLIAPWILAVLAAVAMLGVILGISRLVNYRPGAVAPVMAIMFALPVWIFYRHVGFDEVSYRVLEAEYGPLSPRFSGRDVTDAFLAESTRLDEPLRAQLLGTLAGRDEPRQALQQRFTDRLLCEHLAEQRAAHEACRAFTLTHPKSRYVPNVLYIQASVLDTRLNVHGVLPPNLPLRCEFYTDFPHVQSQETWSALLTNYPDGPLAVVARLRLAQLRLRQGRSDETLELLAPVLPATAAADNLPPSTRPAGRGRGVIETLGFDPEPYRRDARRLHELVAANRNDPQYADEPLGRLFSLDPHRPNARTQLLYLAAEYRDSLLYDNLIVLWAANATDRAERDSLLRSAAEHFTTGDALPEALFRLAELEVQARGEDQELRREDGLARLRHIRARYAETLWGQLAAERLNAIQPGEPKTAAVTPP